MKTIIKTLLLLQLTVLAVNTTFADPAASTKTIPFRGSLQGAETGVIDFPAVLVDGAASGNASHLGRFTLAYEAVVDLLTGAGTGAAQFIAANGDGIFAEDVGQAFPSGIPGLINIVEAFTITGGTGRFSGVTGCFTLERSLDQATGITAGSFEGSITVPGT